MYTTRQNDTGNANAEQFSFWCLAWNAGKQAAASTLNECGVRALLLNSFYLFRFWSVWLGWWLFSLVFFCCFSFFFFCRSQIVHWTMTAIISHTRNTQCTVHRHTWIIRHTRAYTKHVSCSSAARENTFITQIDGAKCTPSLCFPLPLCIYTMELWYTELSRPCFCCCCWMVDRRCQCAACYVWVFAACTINRMRPAQRTTKAERRRRNWNFF